MAWFADLTPHTYSSRDRTSRPDVVNIGWLDDAHAIHRGTVAPWFMERLRTLIANPVNLYRGSHRCQLCKDAKKAASGNGEIRVRDRGVTYVAPVLVLHYIEAHEYQPPSAFLAAVMHGDVVWDGDPRDREELVMAKPRTQVSQDEVCEPEIRQATFAAIDRAVERTLGTQSICVRCMTEEMFRVAGKLLLTLGSHDEHGMEIAKELAAQVATLLGSVAGATTPEEFAARLQGSGTAPGVH